MAELVREIESVDIPKLKELMKMVFGDDEWKHWVQHLVNLNNKFKNYINISILFDKDEITGYKAAPVDEGVDKFLQLWKNKIRL